MREPLKIPKDIEKDTKYDIMVSDKTGKHDEQIILFVVETQSEKLRKSGDSSERLKIIDFDSVRLIPTDALKSLRGLTDETICRI